MKARFESVLSYCAFKRCTVGGFNTGTVSLHSLTMSVDCIPIPWRIHSSDSYLPPEADDRLKPRSRAAREDVCKQGGTSEWSGKEMRRVCMEIPAHHNKTFRDSIVSAAYYKKTVRNRLCQLCTIRLAEDSLVPAVQYAKSLRDRIVSAVRPYQRTQGRRRGRGGGRRGERRGSHLHA